MPDSNAPMNQPGTTVNPGGEMPDKNMSTSNASPAPVSQPISMSGDSMMRGGKKPSKKLMTMILAIILALLVIAGGVFAYFKYIAVNPDQIVKDSLANFNEIDSMKFKGNLNIEDKTARQPMTFLLDFNGGVDTPNQRAGFNFDFTVNGTKISFSVVGTNDTAYMRFSGLSALQRILPAEYASFSGVFSAVDNTWIKLDEQFLERLSGTQANAEPMSEEDKRKVREIIDRHDVLRVTEDKGTDTVNGRAAYHYVVELNKDELKALIDELSNSDIQAFKGMGATWGMLEEALNEADLSSFHPELWIDKETKYLTRMMTAGSDAGATVSFDMTFSDFNQPVDIQLPTEFKTIEEVMALLEQTLGFDPTLFLGQ